MARKRIDVEKGLINKGFRKSDGDHHYFNYFNSVGKKTVVFTKTSHSHSEISTNLIALMARQCKLPKQSFELLVDCPLERSTYETLLVNGGHISAIGASLENPNKK